jgi:hypothetical protein
MKLNRSKQTMSLRITVTPNGVRYHLHLVLQQLLNRSRNNVFGRERPSSGDRASTSNLGSSPAKDEVASRSIVERKVPAATHPTAVPCGGYKPLTAIVAENGDRGGGRNIAETVAACAREFAVRNFERRLYTGYGIGASHDATRYCLGQYRDWHRKTAHSL